MDLTTPKCFKAPLFASDGEPAFETNSISLYGKSCKHNTFAAEAFQDPLCKLNLKETSEFVKSFPMPMNTSKECIGFLEVAAAQRRREGMNSVVAQRRAVEAPSTPGRPVFNYSIAKRTFPSKWDDAEKWVISSSCHESPAHALKPSSEVSKISKPFDNQMEVCAEKSGVTEEKVSKLVSSFQGSVVALDQNSNPGVVLNGFLASQDVLLKDKLVGEVEPVLPNFRYSEPSKEGFIFRSSASEAMKDAATEVIHEVKHRDVGTEMTPLGSSTTSRCHTPFKSSSPARHNTPANRSGPLPLGNSSGTNSTIDIAEFQECHLAKLQSGSQYDSVTSNWSSREEEEKEISKSLRHFETGIICRKSASDSRAAAWEEEEKTKCCLRYQREEAKIQAWLNLQTAKAEARSRKLEVKIQKMRSDLEEKLAKRMAVVHKKAEEWSAAASQQHTEQIQRACQQPKKMMSRHGLQYSSHISCGCFPCNNHP